MPLRPDIAIFGMNYPPEPTGIAPYTGALAAGLHKRGYEVTAHVAQPHYPQWRIYKGYEQWARADSLDGVAVRRRWHYVPHSPHGIRRLLSELSFGARLVFARWNSCRAVIVVSPALFSSVLVALRIWLTSRRPPLVIWVQDFYALGMAETGEGAKFAGKVTRYVEAQTLRAADCVVVIHPRFARYAVEELGVKAQNIVVVRNWAHLPAEAPIDATAAKRALGWPTDATLAVHTGNMGVKQGLENVVEAARVADSLGAPVHFVLVGDGSERHKLMARGRGISRLTFVDPLCDADYRLALSAADVLLVNEKPGVATMAVPSKLTSYFHAGRPVIAATDPAGISAEEVVASGAGTVVSAGEPSTLLNAVVDISADAEAAVRFGLNGQRYREAVLDEGVAIEQWAKLIGDVFANDGQREGQSSQTIRETRPRGLGTTPPFAQFPPAS
jgi:glycosyltransferase involved in cell wall biosynthesis